MEYQSARIFDNVPENFSKPRFRILAVNSELYAVPPWDRFKSVIKEALIDTDEKDVEVIIETLETKVKTKKGITEDAFRSLSSFRGMMSGEIKERVLRMHCEGVFAALLEARTRQLKSSADTDLETLDKYSKVLGLVSRCVSFIHILPEFG